MKYRFLQTLIFMVFVCIGVTPMQAQTDDEGYVWVDLFQDDFGGNEERNSTLAPDASSIKGTMFMGSGGVITKYSGNPNLSGCFALTKTSTDNRSWHEGSDHTYLGDKTKGYYLRVNPNSGRGNIRIYTQEIDGVCPGVRFIFTAWFANLMKVSGTGLTPKLGIMVNSAEDGTGTIFAENTIELDKTPDASENLAWQELSIDFKVTGRTTKVYFIITVNNAETNGYDFAVDDISIKVQHPKVPIETDIKDFAYGDEVNLISTFQNEGFFTSINNVVYQWYYSPTGEEGTFVQKTGENYKAKYPYNISAFDKDVDNGFYRLKIGESTSFNSDVCTISGDYQINETKYKKRVKLCANDVITVDGYAVDATKVKNGDLIDANSSLSIIVSKMEPKIVDKGNKVLCIGENFTYLGKNYLYTEPGEDVVRDIAKSKIFKNSNGETCDSVYTDFTITATDAAEINQPAKVICQGEEFGELDKVKYDEAGEFKHIEDGSCAKLITPLTVNPTYNLPRDYTICEGSSLEGENFAKGGLYNRTYKRTTIKGCDSIVNATINVTSKMIVKLDDVVLCEGDTYEFDGKTYTAPGVYQLESTATSKETGCDSITMQTLTINKTVENSKNPIDTFICYGSKVFGVQYDQPTTTPLLIRDPTTYVSAAGCDSIVYYSLTVIQVELRLAISYGRNNICRGEEVEIDVATLKPSDATLSWSHAFDGSKMKALFKPDRDVSYVVIARNEKAGCKTSDTMHVYVRESPTLTIDTVDQKTNHVEYHVEGGVEPYNIYVDRRLSTDPYGEVNNTFIGMHTLMVSDSTECTSTQIYNIAPVPVEPSVVFTPNGDGVNDRWVIENIDVYEKARIRIFDRTGKILREYNGYDNENGWDGTYNGHLLPPTDYWYEINLPEIDKQYIGHFTLFYVLQ